MQISKELASRHYAIHQGKPFYEPLLEYVTSGPVAVMVWEAPNAISIVRKTLGATRPAEAEPGTIRGDFGLEVGRNIVHGSDGPESAAFEIDLFFEKDELVNWQRSLDRWIFE
jgi:nucleoside-diphosphate kinase